ncbi:MAG: PQQ-binding-like beta-propeller repeat protein [Thermoguttaceae bacterium]
MPLLPLMQRTHFLSLLLVLLVSTAHSADWPTYRGEAGRTGYTSTSLPAELSSRWAFRLPDAPQPAWPQSDRQPEDRANQIVVAGGAVFLGSSADGKVYALNEANGQLKWTFATDAPIRFAPAVWQDRLFVASDDGHLYALSTDDGRLLWKRRGGPDNRSILGNGRMISKWPARGGPVVVDDRVYFAAGIWPSEGIYLYALDAAGGEVLWVNDDSGGIRMPQPHGGAVAESGVSAQGYLVAAGDRLLMPTGRAVPACFDRSDGTFQYFHLQANGHSGGAPTTADGETFFNAGIAYGLVDGKKTFSVGPGALAVMPDGLVHASGTKVVASTLTSAETPDRRGTPEPAVVPKQRWSSEIGFACSSLIVADNRVVAGGDGQVATLDLKTGKVDSSIQVPGTVYGLAATDRGLFVSTDEGTIHCFGQAAPASGPTTIEQPAQSPYSDDSPAAQTAEWVIQKSRIIKGYCVDLGCGDGELAYHLARHTDLMIYAVDDDPARVARARAKLTLAGLYGTRVTVHLRDLANTGYPTNFANLVVCGRYASEGESALSMMEARRLKRPYNSRICVKKGDASLIITGGPILGAGSWTHQYADPANTVCSNDRLVRGRLGMLWFRDVEFEVANRHGRAPAPLCKNGRLIYAGLHGVIAVDAFNGHELWRYAIKDLLTAYNGDELMGIAGTGSNICMVGGDVYVRHEDRCFRLDAATGKLLAEFTMPDSSDDNRPTWGFLACENGILYGSAANSEHVVTYRYINRGGDMNRLLTESSRLFAMDAKTGELKWSYQAEHSLRHNAIALAEGKVFLIDRPLALFDRDRSSKTLDHPTGRLVALSGTTGDVLWKQDEGIDGTMLAVGKKYDVLLMSYQSTRFQLASERGGRMAGFDTETGRKLWAIDAGYQSRPMIIDRTIYAQGGAWDLSTGEPVPFDFQRSYGCGILASGAHMLLFRSATLGYYDLSGNRRTENYGGIRPGCWINAIAADGIVLVPEATAGCRCSYLTRSWFALQPEVANR